MVNLDVKIKIPFLWGKSSFVKRQWAQVNLIVGPNGSGKTLLAEELFNQFKQNGFDVSFLRSERVHQDESLAILQKNPEVRMRIESVLSNMFAKSIRFEEVCEGQFLPIVVNKNRGVEYNLRQGECHGLKEIITLLIALYSTKSGVLIVDEPELHLHPQFQQFFMNEIRIVSAKNPNRIFFLITHSPYFIDLNFPEDLLGVIVCHINNVPTSIDDFTSKDEALFRRFLPRFNTYHKQFFFSDNQIFVEGYTDQQVLTRLLCCIDNRANSVGTGIIDVGGKDELGVFFKVCSLLGTDGRIITDLDSLFCGKLRDVVCEDERVNLWLEKQLDKQMPFYTTLFTHRQLETSITIEKLIARLEVFLIEIGRHIYEVDYNINEELDLFVEKVSALYDKYEKPESLDTFKTVVLMGVQKLCYELADILPVPLAKNIPIIINLANLIFAAFEAARVYILPNGCIEHYYTQTQSRYMPLSSKDKLFHAEYEYMVEETPLKLKQDYKELVQILNKACER